MKTIVVPIDFSAISENAAYYAAEMASVTGSNLALLHVCQVPLVISEIPVSQPQTEELIQEAFSRISRLRDQIFQQLKGDVKIDVDVKSGDVLTEINSFCSLLDTYAVVMGTESTTAFERLFFGGKTFEALDEIPWPLIIVPENAVFSGIKKIGLACDLQQIQETVPVAEIKKIVTDFQAELHVLTVFKETAENLDANMIRESRRLHVLLKDLQPVYHYSSAENIENEIVAFAEKSKFDFLMVIPKKHNLINKLFTKSHSRNILLQTQIPILSIHD